MHFHFSTIAYDWHYTTTMRTVFASRRAETCLPHRNAVPTARNDGSCNDMYSSGYITIRKQLVEICRGSPSPLVVNATSRPFVTINVVADNTDTRT